MDGADDRLIVGAKLIAMANVGRLLGDLEELGATEGTAEGLVEGALVGRNDGVTVGAVGQKEGASVGPEGAIEGSSLGTSVGKTDGSMEGIDDEGAIVGKAVGLCEGDRLSSLRIGDLNR